MTQVLGVMEAVDKQVCRRRRLGGGFSAVLVCSGGLVRHSQTEAAVMAVGQGCVCISCDRANMRLHWGLCLL